MTMRKTLKTVSKRIRITKRAKFMRRVSHQSHFKAKETGKMRRLKRKFLTGQEVHPLIKKAIKRNMPYVIEGRKTVWRG